MMNEVVYSDTVGCKDRNDGPFLRECENIPEKLKGALLKRLGSDCRLTPIQQEAIEAGICNQSSHFIISAPTNSGKTLVGLFRIFSDVLSKKSRCVYVVPLKALAEQKRGELEELCKLIADLGGPRIRLCVTTGDYQLTQDFLGSPPPQDGEVIICTPERLEIILRSKENIFWARAVSTFVLDEFHLLGDSNRGPTIEILTTRILVSCPWSRIVALSATMGEFRAVKEWLELGGSHVTVIENEWRYPVLNRRVVSTNDKDSFSKEMVGEILGNPGRSLIIFVNQKREAERLKKILQKDNEDFKDTITYLHAGLTLKDRTTRLSNLLEGKNRVVAATTALKMGIDAPVTDVLIRDPFLWTEKGAIFLKYSDIQQMMGRAGRRETPGNSVILGEPDEAKNISEMLRSGSVEQLHPQLNNEKKRGRGKDTEPVLSILLAEIVMQGQTTIPHLNEYLSHTFTYGTIGSMDSRKQTNELIRLKLAYNEEGSPENICTTKLGRTVSRAGLSPESGAILAGFLRALIKLDKKHEERKGRRYGYLKRLTDLDLIFLCCACHECRNSLLKIPGKKAIADVKEFVELLAPEEKPIVNLWCDENSSEYPTRRLLTSLRIPFDSNKKGNAEKVFYKFLRTAVLLYQHARGVPLASLSIKFKASLGELENGLKFTVLWVLNCFSQICNGKHCYKFDFLMMKAIKLIECVSIGSELGELLTIKGIGRRSVLNFVEGGINSFDDLAECSLSDILGMGIKERQAKLIHRWVSRRFR